MKRTCKNSKSKTGVVSNQTQETRRTTKRKRQKNLYNFRNFLSSLSSSSRFMRSFSCSSGAKSSKIFFQNFNSSASSPRRSNSSIIFPMPLFFAPFIISLQFPIQLSKISFRLFAYSACVLDKLFAFACKVGSGFFKKRGCLGEFFFGSRGDILHHFRTEFNVCNNTDSASRGERRVWRNAYC